MPTFIVSAYQEMVTTQTVDAASEEEAQPVFKDLCAEGKVIWQPSDEDVEIAEVIPQDATE